MKAGKSLLSRSFGYCILSDRKVGTDFHEPVEFSRNPGIPKCATLKIVFRKICNEVKFVMKNVLKPDEGKQILNKIEIV